MSSLARILAASTALLAATIGVATAQDWRLAPTYGTVNLTTGFQPDPTNIQLQSGGPIDASQTIGGACRGFVANAPDYDLNFTAGSSLPLIISVNSNQDTTLVVNGPDGQWYCDDDSGNGNNPSLTFAHPTSGLYDIYVGTYGGATLAPATLSISELRSN